MLIYSNSFLSFKCVIVRPGAAGAGPRPGHYSGSDLRYCIFIFLGGVPDHILTSAVTEMFDNFQPLL